jgi:hypothetical protein
MTLKPQSDRLRLRTGGRKINADDCALAYPVQVYISVADIRMIRIGENIHATYPSYATVAPILHRSGRKTPVDRSTTLNNGATDADGR